MATKTLNTRIQLKYDTLDNWIASARTTPPFKPLKGEICIVEIPNTNTAAETTQNDQGNLTPPAIGIKVGDGSNHFLGLPWIQGLAGDVYGWAKQVNPPTASQLIYDSENNESIKTKIDSIVGSLQVDTNTQYRIVRGTEDNANKYYLQSKAKDETFSDSITETAFLDLTDVINSISNLGTAANATVATGPIADNDSSTDLTTKQQVASYVAEKTAGLTYAMHYKGTVTADPTKTAPSGNYIEGDVVTFNISEYVYDGSSWRELGTEGSYAIKGSITKTDLDSSLQTEIDNKVVKNGTDRLMTADEGTKLSGIETGAQVNTLEKITVPSDSGTGADKELTITNKTVKLAKIADTGNVNDLIQTTGDYLILYCGDADELI